jgi:hypothetical protein
MDLKNASSIPVEQIIQPTRAENGANPHDKPGTATGRPNERPSFVELKSNGCVSPLPTTSQTRAPKALRLIPPAALKFPLSGAGTSTHEENQFVDRYRRYDGQLTPFEQWMA